MFTGQDGRWRFPFAMYVICQQKKHLLGSLAIQPLPFHCCPYQLCVDQLLAPHVSFVLAPLAMLDALLVAILRCLARPWLGPNWF